MQDGCKNRILHLFKTIKSSKTGNRQKKARFCRFPVFDIVDFVIDHLPIVSEVETVPGFYIAAGHEGDGISLSAITGKMMAQIVAGEETDFNIDQLKFSRFQK